jgi:dipeptidyl-peptidase III
LIDRLAPSFFDPTFDPVVTNKTPGGGRDILASSANNLYRGVTMADVEQFEERYGLNSRLVKRDGVLVEEVYRQGGLYDRYIRRIVAHLRDGIDVATPPMADALRALIRFYETGEEADRIAYDIAWVRDRDSPVDTINGFVEVYMDPRGTKGSWEAIVCFVNEEKTARIRTLAAAAQWFEDRMPWDPRFRKPEVLGVSARAIDVVIETGDSGPLSAIGINLPNDQTIRERYGSKSVSLSNINEAYVHSTPEGLRTEFSWTEEEAARARKWGAASQELTTDMHEVIGHGSGRMSDGIVTPPQLLLKEHYSTIEESRADLVALYFVADPRLVELGLVDASDHAEMVRTEYEYYTRTALVQLRRVREGTHIEEDHMRNRQLIVHWLMAHTPAIDVRRRNGKTYYVLTDVDAFREGVGRLLAEVQRIKSEGDYQAAQALVETYGIHFDPAIRDEVVRRVDALQLPSYTAFVMPRLEPVVDGDGTITDVEISYPCDFEQQMLEYSEFAKGDVQFED